MKNTINELSFPRNLFADLGVEAPAEQPEDFYATLLYVLHSIASAKDVNAVLLRYQYGKSFDEIGERLGCSRQNVHIAVHEALENLSPNYIDMLTKGIKAYMESLLKERIDSMSALIQQSATSDMQFTLYSKGYNKGYEDGLAEKEKNAFDPDAIKDIHLDTLGLSVRTVNACNNNRMYTIGDVLNVRDYILHCRSFGAKWFHELAEMLMSYGVNVNSFFPNTVKKYGLE